MRENSSLLLKYNKFSVSCDYRQMTKRRSELAQQEVFVFSVITYPSGMVIERFSALSAAVI